MGKYYCRYKQENNFHRINYLQKKTSHSTLDTEQEEDRLPVYKKSLHGAGCELKI